LTLNRWYPSKSSSYPGSLQDALIRLLIQKGIFREGEFLKMVKEVNHEMKTKKKG